MSAERRIGFTIVRMLDATPRQVWRMWTEPSELTHWLHPDGAVTPTATIHFDVREGGRLRYTMIDEVTGETYAISGVFREVDPHRRLVFSWGADDRRDDDEVTVITVNLVDRAGRTELTLDVRGDSGVAGDDDVYDGWDRALRLLAERVTTGRVPHEASTSLDAHEQRSRSVEGVPDDGDVAGRLHHGPP